jgi:hypothetical protein
MAINWTNVGKQVEESVGQIVGPAWQNASSGASSQFAAIIAAGQRIEQNKDDMQQIEYDSLKLMQQRALDGVLQTYAGISLDIAQQAAAAAWTVVAGAIKTAYPVLGFII